MKIVKQVLNSSMQVVFVVSVLIAAFVFAMFQGGQVSWTIFYIILPFGLYSLFLFFYPLSDVKVSREIRTPIVESGGKLIVSLSIRRNSFFPLLYTVVTDKWAEPERFTVAGNAWKRLFLFGFRKEKKWEYEIEQMPRGEHVLEGIEIEVADFFGWVRKKKWVPLRHTVLIFPKTIAFQYAPIETQYDHGTLASPLNIIKDTTLATGVRNYQPGDRVTWIHWKSFARTQTLMTKEFEDRRSQDLLVIMDGRKTEVFEDIVELTASLIKEASKNQAGLALMTAGKEISRYPLIQSDAQLHQALVHLAKIQPSEVATGLVSDMVSTTLVGGSAVVITGNPDWTFLQPIVQSVKSNGTLVCYVVTGQGKEPSPSVVNAIQIAKSRGIHVHLLEEHRF